MHLYVMTRGIKHDVDLFITQLQGQYLKSKWIDSEGKVNNSHIQFAVRPIQLWEMVYPKTEHDLICSTFFGQDKAMNMHKKHNLPLSIIRKGLGVGKIDYNPINMMLPVYHDNIEIVGVGQKPDAVLKFKGEIVKDKDGKEIEGL